MRISKKTWQSDAHVKSRILWTRTQLCMIVQFIVFWFGYAIGIYKLKLGFIKQSRHHGRIWVVSILMAVRSAHLAPAADWSLCMALRDSNRPIFVVRREMFGKWFTICSPSRNSLQKWACKWVWSRFPRWPTCSWCVCWSRSIWGWMQWRKCPLTAPSLCFSEPHTLCTCTKKSQ